MNKYKKRNYYKGNRFEAIDVINDFGLNFNLGNIIKYVLRAGRKNNNSVDELKKAIAYAEYEIKRIEEREKQLKEN